MQHGTPPWELQTPHRGNYRPPTVGITDPTEGITEK